MEKATDLIEALKSGHKYTYEELKDLIDTYNERKETGIPSDRADIQEDIREYGIEKTKISNRITYLTGKIGTSASWLMGKAKGKSFTPSKSVTAMYNQLKKHHRDDSGVSANISSISKWMVEKAKKEDSYNIIAGNIRTAQTSLSNLNTEENNIDALLIILNESLQTVSENRSEGVKGRMLNLSAQGLTLETMRLDHLADAVPKIQDGQADAENKRDDKITENEIEKKEAETKLSTEKAKGQTKNFVIIAIVVLAVGIIGFLAYKKISKK